LTHRRGRGQEAEELAAGYLERQGYRILERNFFWKGLELDIVATDEDLIAFVEVRSLREDLGFNPIASIGPRKRAQLIRAAKVYLSQKKLFGTADCRFDVIGVVRSRDGGHRIEHLEDAFRES
jgi:putative endonuclease